MTGFASTVHLMRARPYTHCSRYARVMCRWGSSSVASWMLAITLLLPGGLLGGLGGDVDGTNGKGKGA